MDEIFQNGVENLVLAGVGGTMAIMMPFEAFAKKEQQYLYIWKMRLRSFLEPIKRLQKNHLWFFIVIQERQKRR